MKIRGLLLISLLWIVGCSQLKKRSFPIVELNYPVELRVVTRANWGSLSLQKVLPEHTIAKITIHHGGVDYPEGKDPIMHIRNLQEWSMSTEKNWIDIPYHFMIDLDGKIYETRPINYPGATNTDYDPTGHALICVMGNYENQIISEAQLEAVVDLSAFLAKLYNVSPDDIKGHKDYTETACPGQDLYRYLEDGTIRSRVAEKLKF
ncbi:MAG: N-acetylmuramoyl-L-alanine amidase [Candidatus Marinimicrobia bacterium]|nr:N-acetylmuramoyl-L-alanine amidase [Candidatus Neomarinimicrobiota bacterium]